MEQLPNEIFIQIFDNLDPVSYVSFLETGFRKSELINTTQYERMKKEYVDWLDKEKFKRSMKEAIENIENNDFGEVSELGESGINVDNWDTSGMTPDIINVLGDNMYDIIKEMEDDTGDTQGDGNNFLNSGTLMKMMEKLNSVPAFQTEEFQSAMRSLGQSVVDNNPEFLVNDVLNNIPVPDDLPDIVPIPAGPDVPVPDGVPGDLRDVINNLPDFNPANLVNEIQGIFNFVPAPNPVPNPEWMGVLNDTLNNLNYNDEVIQLRPIPNFNPPEPRVYDIHLVNSNTPEDNSDNTPEDNSDNTPEDNSDTSKNK